MTLEELKEKRPLTIKVSEAAEIMGVTAQFLRIALQLDKFPFGTAVKMSQFEYYINTYRFLLYMEGADFNYIKSIPPKIIGGPV